MAASSRPRLPGSTSEGGFPSEGLLNRRPGALPGAPLRLRPMAKQKEKEKDGAKAGQRIPKKAYAHELVRLQEELVKMEDWVSAQGLRVLVIFEGRDAAGKGGVIK